MESLKIRTGQVNLQILDDYGNERGIFSFNPEDVNSAKRILELQDELKEKSKEMETKQAACETDAEKVNLLVETVNYFRDLVDSCFGEGTSQTVFGNACTLSMFYDFFEGITPYYEKASKKRMEKYTGKK